MTPLDTTTQVGETHLLFRTYNRRSPRAIACRTSWLSLPLTLSPPRSPHGSRCDNQRTVWSRVEDAAAVGVVTSVPCSRVEDAAAVGRGRHTHHAAQVMHLVRGRGRGRAGVRVRVRGRSRVGRSGGRVHLSAMTGAPGLSTALADAAVVRVRVRGRG